MKAVLYLLGLLLALTSATKAQTDGSSQQAKQFLAEYGQRVNQLSQKPLPEGVARIRECFSHDTVRMPSILLPFPLYQASRAEETVHSWLGQLPNYFWEGFTYRLDTSHVQCETLPHDKNQIRFRLILPVGLHGLTQRTRKRHSYQEDQAFIVSASKNDTRSWKIEEIRGTGEGIRETPMNARQLLDYHEELQSSLMQLVFEKTSDEHKQKLLKKLKSYVPLDERIFEWKKFPGKKMTLAEIAELRLPAEEAARYHLDAFDLHYQGNFYQDRDGSWQSDVITLRGISVWIDGKLNYQNRQTDTIPGEPPFQEKISLTYLAFTL